MTRSANRSACLFVLLFVASPLGVSAQDTRVWQLGAGVWPGVGVHAGYVKAQTVFTLDAILYVNAHPTVDYSKNQMQLSGGIGAALRPLGVLRSIGYAKYGYGDVDIGIRFGPSFMFPTDASRADKNTHFNLFLDPFVRLSFSIGGRTLFFETGPLEPVVRVGGWVTLR